MLTRVAQFSARLRIRVRAAAGDEKYSRSGIGGLKMFRGVSGPITGDVIVRSGGGAMAGVTHDDRPGDAVRLCRPDHRHIIVDESEGVDPDEYSVFSKLPS